MNHLQYNSSSSLSASGHHTLGSKEVYLLLGLHVRGGKVPYNAPEASITGIVIGEGVFRFLFRNRSRGARLVLRWYGGLGILFGAASAAFLQQPSLGGVARREDWVFGMVVKRTTACAVAAGAGGFLHGGRNVAILVLAGARVDKMKALGLGVTLEVHPRSALLGSSVSSNQSWNGINSFTPPMHGMPVDRAGDSPGNTGDLREQHLVPFMHDLSP